MFPAHVQKFISSYYVFGLLPLDKVLHFIVGVFVTIVLRKWGASMRRTVTVLLLFALLKELIDSFTLNNSFFEHCIDVFATMIYPMLVWLIIMLKTEKHSNSTPDQRIR